MTSAYRFAGKVITDVMRVEVQRDPEPGELVNLIVNPSGELGAWGWVTPVVGSVLTAETTGYTEAAEAARGLVYITAAAVGGNPFYSEAFTVAAGQAVLGRWRATYVQTGDYRARFDWLDSAGALVGSTAWKGFAGVSAPAWHTAGPAVAPVGVSSARLVLEIRSGVNPYATAGGRLAVREVAVAVVPATVRTNLVTNPSFETNTTGWTNVNPTTGVPSGTLSRSLAGGHVGSGHLVASASAWGTTPALVAGQTYTLSCWLRGESSTITGTIGEHYTASPATPFTATTSAWTRFSCTFVAHVSSSRPLITKTSGMGGLWVDGVMVEQAGTVGAYFDGATPDVPDSKGYTWTGTAHNSTSTEGTYTLGLAVAGLYADVTGPSTSVTITRDELSVGLLDVTIRDATIDPATADLIRPGRRVRVTALNTESGEFEPIFLGKATAAEVEYDVRRELVKPGDPKNAKITLSAVDAVQALAGVSRPQGVGSVAALPWLLEGAGVPWNCDGSGNQIASATVVSVNENATAVDQVAVTRDTVHGRAWIDRWGVLQAWTLPEDGTNLVTNPSFETNTTGWTNNVGTMTRPSVAGAPDGSFVCRVAHSLSAGAAMGIETTAGVAITGPRYVTITAWVRTTVLDAVQIGTTGREEVRPVTPGSWQKVSFTGLYTGSTTPTVVVRGFMTSGVAAPGAVIEVDRVSVTMSRPIVDLAEDVYSNIVPSFDSTHCINDVRVKYVRYNPTTGQSEEVFYGPFVDEPSIEEWGRNSKEFTVHGLTETVPTFEAFADEVLAANAVPQVRVSEVLVPVREDDDLTPAGAFLDLGDLVRLRYAAKGIDELSRVERVEHRITPTGWLVTAGFAPIGSVASPQVTPPVQSPDPGGWITPTLLSGWTVMNTVGYRRIGDVVHGRGRVNDGTAGQTLFVLPPDCRPSAQFRSIAVPCSAFPDFAWLIIWPNGDVRPEAPALGGAGAWYSVDFSFAI